MKPPVLFAIFIATWITSNCLAQEQESAASSSQQTEQTSESSISTTVSSSPQEGATSDSNIIIDKAPSGNEQAEKSINPDTGASVTIPGKDAPVSETTQGNTRILDFDVSDPSKAKEEDTTIIIERPEPQAPPATQGEQNQQDNSDTQSNQ